MIGQLSWPFGSFRLSRVEELIQRCLFTSTENRRGESRSNGTSTLEDAIVLVATERAVHDGLDDALLLFRWWDDTGQQSRTGCHEFASLGISDLVALILWLGWTVWDRDALLLDVCTLLSSILEPRDGLLGRTEGT